MYESNTGAVTDALAQANANVFNQATIDRILALTASTPGDTNVTITEAIVTNGQVDVPTGTELLFLSSNETVQTSLIAPASTPVVVLQGAGGFNLNFQDAPVTPTADYKPLVDRVVVHSQGADKIVIEDGKNTQVTIGAGDTVIGGAGYDTVIAGAGDSTVIGGSGFTTVELGGSSSDYTVTYVDGRAVVSNTVTGVTTEMSNVQFIQLDNGEALVLANDSLEAAVSFLYETTFGRSADGVGLDFWFDRAREGVSLSDIANAFTTANEFQNLASVSNEAFIQGAFQNTFNRSASTVELLQWTAALEGGSTRGDLLEYLVDTAAQHLDGTLQGEVTLTGTITIVPGIIG